MNALQPDAKGIRRMDFHAMGTTCSIRFRLDDEHDALAFAADALGWLGQFEEKFSRYRPASLISRVNASAGGDWVPIDSSMERLLDLAEDLHHRTKGILDPTMLPLLQLWNWKEAPRRLPQEAEVRAALCLTGWDKVQRRKGSVRLPATGMGLDFGGFGKEFAVDQIIRIARERGISDALVDFGRDIFAIGGNGSHPFWHVGIEDGLRPGHCWGGLAVTDRAVCASGDYARYFTHEGRRYGHILDPRTGWPVSNGMRAVTVIAPSCLEAGAYSTTAFILGAREGIHLASLCRGVEICTQSESGIDGTRGFGNWLVQAA